MVVLFWCLEGGGRLESRNVILNIRFFLYLNASELFDFFLIFFSAGCEGRAGMASLKLKNGDTLLNSQLKDLFELCQRKLASYSIPLFLRVQKEMLITGTFKYQKSVLKEEGFDPNIISDSLYFMDSSHKHYVPLLKDIYYKIVTGKVRL